MVTEETYNHVYEYVVDKLKDAKRDNFATLKRTVISTGVCTSCGACVASCESGAIDMVAGRPTLVGNCSGCGVCLHQCPRTITTPEGLLGNYKFARKGKSNLAQVKGQDGGIVTTLLAYTLDEKLIDCAVVTTKSEEEPWRPIPAIVTNSADLLASAGTIYNQCQTVSTLLRAIKRGYRSIGFVGTPCHIDAVHKMEESPLGIIRLFGRAHIFKIGLFCMDSFTYESLAHFLEHVKGIPVSLITKMDISKGKFCVTYDGDKTASWKIHEMDNLRTSSCYYCTDLTSEHADISVGSVGSPEDHSTILARTSYGAQIIQDAEEKEYLSTEPLTQVGLRALMNLARMKKVQLYTMRRRRRYVIDRVTFPATPTEIRSVAVETDADVVPVTALEPGVFRRRVIRTANIRLLEDGQKIGVTLINTSGCVLEAVKIQIGHIQDLFETYSWKTSVDIWFPAEEFEFEFARQENDAEYILHIEDRQGKILTKKIEVDKLEQSER